MKPNGVLRPGHAGARFLARCVEQRTPGKYLAVTIEAPRALPEAFLASTREPSAALWIPQHGPGFASAGIAKKIRVTRGGDRWRRLRSEIGATFADLEAYADPEACRGRRRPPLPRFLGGMAFAEGGGDGEPWKAFGDGFFVLPRWTYCVDGDDELGAPTTEPFGAVAGDPSFLTLVLGPDDQSSGPVILEELEAVLDGLTETAVSLWAPPIPTTHIEQLPLDAWIAILDRVRPYLTAGELHKVVVARRSAIALPAKSRDVTMLARLRRELPECTRFAFRTEGATFLGATPELLFAKSGSALRTEALAGSIRCTGSDFPRVTEQTGRLLQSEKDLREHRLVVDQIVSRVAPLLERQPLVQPPAALRFRNIIHLHTPLAGTVLARSDAIALLEALHPTAAVGGVPASLAAECIRAIEPCARGWYAGPVGFIDQEGNATFCVAIRSGLLAPPRAYIYAGAGILAESDPIAEYSETGLKQMPMMLALGVDTVSLRATLAPQASP